MILFLLPTSTSSYAISTPPEALKSPTPIEKPKDVPGLIKYYSEVYNIDYRLPMEVARAESGFNPLAKNKHSTASGVFQFIRSTWAENCEGDVFNADDNVRCAVRMIGEGGIRHWDASKHVWGKRLSN